MSSTLLKRLKAYKCDVPECYKTIYAVIATTAESNIRPIEYHNWVIATGMNHEIMGTLCGIANDIFNGNIHWNNTWGEMGICSRFMTYAEKTITEAKKQETAILNWTTTRSCILKRQILQQICFRALPS